MMASARYSKGFSKTGGFTLVELMLVVVIIGILSAIALPAFSRYVKKSRTVEAALVLGKMWTGAVAYYEADHADVSTTILPKQFPGDGGACGLICAWNPASGCTMRTKCPVSLFAQNNDCFAWARTGYSLTSDFYYMPVFIALGTPPHSVWAWVEGDLDCDDVNSRFEIRGSVHQEWNNAATPKGDPWRSPMLVVNELE